jgi:hypothetical protein
MSAVQLEITSREEREGGKMMVGGKYGDLWAM